MTARTYTDWETAPLVAVDLEGSGAQDRDDEAILEIAVVPITGGRPDLQTAYSTLVNPGRVIPRRPWISPGLTTAVLSAAPRPDDVEPELAHRINGRIMVGHNVTVDWRLLHRRYPRITPIALVDTLRLARYLKVGAGKSLSTLANLLGISAQAGELAPGSQPHRALWDTVATALLLRALIAKGWPSGANLATILDVAATDLGLPTAQRADRAVPTPLVQDTLFVVPPASDIPGGHKAAGRAQRRNACRPQPGQSRSAET